LCEVLDSTDQDASLQEELDQVALILAHFYSAANSLLRLLEHLISREIGHTAEAAVLFRRNSLTTKLLTQYCRMTGHRYLRMLQAPIKALLAEVAHQVALGAGNCVELDPSRLREGQSARANCARLTEHVDVFLERVLGSVNSCPAGMRQLCRHLRDQTALRFPQHRLSVVASFIFLRYICPAVLPLHSSPVSLIIVRRSPSLHTHSLFLSSLSVASSSMHKLPLAFQL
jgi:hypothetical protein